MFRSLLIIALATCGACEPGRKWDRANYALEGAFVGEAAIDEYQTETIVANCQEYNPIIGACGQRMPASAYIATAIIAHVAISWLLPPRARLVWQGATLGAEGHVIYFNAITPDRKRATP